MSTKQVTYADMQQHRDSIESQFARKLVARLDLGSQDVPHDVSERLRVARQQALARRKQAAAAVSLADATMVQVSGPVASLGLGRGFGDEKLGLFNRIANFLPILALLVGLVALNGFLNDDRADALAEVDSALLTDDLPPAAYVDPGFAHFLKANPDSSQ